MTRLQVFDPPMCCSTGVCGPQVDPQLPRFAADLQWLQKQGLEVERFNLTQQPQAFVQNAVVKQALVDEGERCLPLVLVDGQIVSRGVYPERDELAALAGVDFTAEGSLYSRAVEELVAIGAAIGANCEPCFKYHFQAAREAGATRDDIAQAVATARQVKQAASKEILNLAGKFLAADRDTEFLKIAPCCPSGSENTKSNCC
jgi:AhpD family alkylhydroperoxidase